MNDRFTPQEVTLSIAAVERDTGLSKDTLRVWERRYGFPQPGRDAFGERTYPLDQVDKLRAVRRLMDAGHRPGRIIGLSVDQLRQLSEQASSGPKSIAQVSAERDDLQIYLEIVKEHRVEDLRRTLSRTLLKVGLERFVTEVVAPLTRMVGDAWARGYFEVFEEHIFTESMQVILRGAISNIPQGGKSPVVLLTTFPNESHGLGLLMAEALIALEGARCISLGVQTPIIDIVMACESQNVDILALSFSACMNPNQILEGLSELHLKLGPNVAIWAGGNCPVLQRRPPTGVDVLPNLDDIHPMLIKWRSKSS